MSFACSRINNEPLSTNLLGNEFKHPPQTRRNQLFSPDHEQNPRGEAGCAVRLDRHNDRPVPTGFPCQRPLKQYEACAAFTHPRKNELSYSAVTQGKKLLRHPVVEQLVMIGSRLAIPEQDPQKSTNNPDGTTHELSPKSCLAGLSNTWWSEV